MGNNCCGDSESRDSYKQRSTTGKYAPFTSTKQGIETSILLHEQKMTISKVNIETFLSGLDGMAKEGSISHQEFVKLLSERNIGYDRVFRALISDQRYDITHLKLIAIVLGCANLKKRFELMFKEFDTNNKQFLDEIELRNLLENLYHVCVNICPKAAIGDNLDALDFHDIEEYLNIFIHKKEILIRSICDRVLSCGRVSYNVFIQEFSNPKKRYAMIAHTYGFRKLLREIE